MKPIAWIAGGFALSGLAAALESLGDVGSNPAARLPLYIPALFILLGGQYCFWRGFRSGIVALWSGAFDRRRKSPNATTPKPAYRIDDSEQAGGFDADAAFTRYMMQREAGQADPSPQPQPPAPLATSPTRPTFGRRAS